MTKQLYAMPSAESASEHLRTIRSLMERATVYRAVSGPGALAGGGLALAIGGFLLAKEDSWKPSNVEFAGIWCAVLFVVTLFNFYLLYRGSKDRAEPFVSPGMKHALRAISPPLFAGFVLSLILATAGASDTGACAEMVALWILFYGLSLLAAGAFAPRSMQVLGVAFFVMGLTLFLPAVQASAADDYGLALRMMIGCFGILHLLYGAYVMLSNKRPPRFS